LRFRASEGSHGSFAAARSGANPYRSGGRVDGTGRSWLGNWPGRGRKRRAAGDRNRLQFHGNRIEGETNPAYLRCLSERAEQGPKKRISFTKIKEETISLLQQLPINARFGLIQFTQNFKAFGEELLAATEPNRAAATSWIEEEWVETGSMQASAKVTKNPRGVVGVFELASRMLPDVIFLISDASFQWKEGGSLGDVPWEEIAKIIKGVQPSAAGRTSGC
jgi:hypothetical protein